jgi:hypothetical protein
VLYNAISEDYVTLIKAWAAFNGSTSTKPSKKIAKLPDKYSYLMRIEDPAIRGIMQSIIAERDKIKQQLNILKSHSHIVIDQRPLGATIAEGATNVALVETYAQLTDSERSALRNAISSEFLKDRGWYLGNAGEIYSNNGSVLYDPGYETAIRKILGEF